MDNDKAGKDTTKKIIYHLNNQYIIHDNTPYRVKDMNELLKKKIKTNITIDERWLNCGKIGVSIICILVKHLFKRGVKYEWKNLF